MDVYDYTRPASMCHGRGYHRHVMFNLKFQRKYFDYATFDIENVRFSLSINRTLKSVLGT